MGTKKPKRIDNTLIVRGDHNLSDDSKYDLCDPISYCIDASYYKGITIEYFLKTHRRQLIIEQYKDGHSVDR